MINNSQLMFGTRLLLLDVTHFSLKIKHFPATSVELLADNSQDVFTLSTLQLTFALHYCYLACFDFK